MYPLWQHTTHRAVVLSIAIWGVPWSVLEPWLNQLRWCWHLVRRLWHWRAPVHRRCLEAWIARFERLTIEQMETLDAEQVAIIGRVLSVFALPQWEQARIGVHRCATSPKFHQPEQWVEYSRALKANAGQAQNIFRHIKVVHELRAAHPELSNPDAHLLTELAYQGLAEEGRRERRIVNHRKRTIHHARLTVTR